MKNPRAFTEYPIVMETSACMSIKVNYRAQSSTHTNSNIDDGGAVVYSVHKVYNSV